MIKHIKLGSFVTLLLIFAIIIDIYADDEITQKSKQLQEVKKNISEIKKQKSSVTTQKKSLQSELTKINKQLNEKQKELRKYEQNLLSSEAELQKLIRELQIAQNRLDTTKEMLCKRLRAMYKASYGDNRLSYLRVVAGANNMLDVSTQHKYMISIATADKNLLEKAKAEKAELDYRKKRVEEKKEQIIAYKTETERIQKDILNKKNERQKLLAQMTDKERELAKRLIDLEKSAVELERLITRLQTRSQGGASKLRTYEEVISNFDSQSGKLPWPVSGRIIENASPSMRGVTIQAGYGTDIRCVEDGVVDYARMFDGVGYGQMVIINHGKGYRTLYAHASALLVKEGQKVSKGQVIAKVGDTGSNRGPILYFEVWKGAESLPAMQWLMNR